MAEDGDEILDAITRLLPRLMATLDTLAMIARHNHPNRLPDLVDTIGDQDQLLRSALHAIRALTWRPGLAGFRDAMDQSADLALRACDGLRAAVTGGDSRLAAYRALRHQARAVEALYPLAATLPAISRWFLDPAQRNDAALVERLRKPGAGTGVVHLANDINQRGGFSLYVPETYEPSRPHPVVVALHGGSGHGRLFLWSWLREARSRGFIVAAPTAAADTWSLMEPETDSAHLASVLGHIRSRWAVDESRLLLTGMSDGGTFTLLSGLAEDSPFTHLAPVAASFHPAIVSMSAPARVRGLPIYLVHGALDWMFPVSVGRAANRALTAAGAHVTYREIEDLSHTYPQDENPAIVDWLMGTPRGAA